MSIYDYQISQQLSIEDPPFNALIMSAIRKADDGNLARLRGAFPELVNEFEARYYAPGGLLQGERQMATELYG